MKKIHLLGGHEEPWISYCGEQKGTSTSISGRRLATCVKCIKTDAIRDSGLRKPERELRNMAALMLKDGNCE